MLVHPSLSWIFFYLKAYLHFSYAFMYHMNFYKLSSSPQLPTTSKCGGMGPRCGAYNEAAWWNGIPVRCLQQSGVTYKYQYVGKQLCIQMGTLVDPIHIFITVNNAEATSFGRRLTRRQRRKRNTELLAQ
ncbi:hypothetical protein IEQ34_022649 [Dendrobium chrysotoxum]|uniref:Uncharacterized protein n=1 Tax=Dendrobium chrysotoxum TaxID=161865 RepID=A0AAV7FZL6_DENCH|nr:hypothetical protein IEQ34_022649 [Dendrobium chrysotoxum]